MMVMHGCDFYVFDSLYLCLVGDRISVSIYLLFLHSLRKRLANPSNGHFSIFKLI